MTAQRFCSRRHSLLPEPLEALVAGPAIDDGVVMGLPRAILSVLRDGPVTAHALVHRLRERLGPARSLGACQIYETLRQLERHGLASRAGLAVGKRRTQRWEILSAGLDLREAELCLPTAIMLDEHEFLSRVLLLAKRGELDAVRRALALARRDLSGRERAIIKFERSGPWSRTEGNLAAHAPTFKAGLALVLALISADRAWLGNIESTLLPAANTTRADRTNVFSRNAGAASRS